MQPAESIVIRGYGSISPLGHQPAAITKSYQRGKPAFQVKDFNGIGTPVGALPPAADAALEQLAREKKAYQTLDRSVLMAIFASRQAVATAGWQHEAGIAINIGSSRGATGLFETHLEDFWRNGNVPVQTSPVTTLGNISSWVGQDLSSAGPTISHSVTCSTGLQAIANGFAWLKSGMANKFLAGAAEAPLTPFTVAQMKAIGIYAPATDSPFPCRPLNLEKQNTFVLGEGAAVFALEKISSAEMQSEGQGLILIEAIGFGFETIGSKTGISKEGHNFRIAMQNALTKASNAAPVDLVIMHAPGTVAGDAAELNAVKSIFGKNPLPIISTNKWMVGHTLGASAGLSLAYAIHILQNQHWVPFPYTTAYAPSEPKQIKRILINAAGFGGNASTLLVRKID